VSCRISDNGRMSFSLAEFEPKANDWLSSNLLYEGPGTADFTSPLGSVMGPFVATFNERGDQIVLVTCEQISCCDPDYDPLAFLSGAKVKREGKTKSWGFGGLNNPCSGLKITTDAGTFAASDVRMAGMTAQLIVSKPEDAKRTQLRFRVSEGKFETGNSNEPKFFVLPLLNCTAEPGNSLNVSHPLRIYPTPLLPESLAGKERFVAELAAQKHNSVIGFYFSGRLCFIERLADYAEREASLQAGAQRLITAVLVGELGAEPVTTSSEFFSWFPVEVISALGFASGVEVGFPWIEIRDYQGALIRRLHGRRWLPTFDEGDVLLKSIDAKDASGMGPFLTHYLACARDKRSYLRAAMNHARIGSLGTALRLYDILDHLIRACECLCREHGFVQQNLLPKLSPATEGQVKDILAGVAVALESLIDAAQRSKQFDDVRVLASIRSKAANIAGTEQKFGLAVVDLLQSSGLPDPNIIDGFIAANPRVDRLRDWASVISSYRGATIHEGYMDFDKKHDANDVVRICAHLKDALTRVILKEVGYKGTYESVLARNYGPQAIDWIQPTTEPERLGFS
jgi:hypothetical protein